MFGLDDKYITFIKDTLAKYVPLENAKFYVFGSRAKNIYKPYSDVDIAIDYGGFSDILKSKIEFEFENSTFPYMVDIVDLNSASEEFKNEISPTLISLF